MDDGDEENDGNQDSAIEIYQLNYLPICPILNLIRIPMHYNIELRTCISSIIEKLNF